MSRRLWLGLRNAVTALSCGKVVLKMTLSRGADRGGRGPGALLKGEICRVQCVLGDVDLIHLVDAC